MLAATPALVLCTPSTSTPEPVPTSTPTANEAADERSTTSTQPATTRDHASSGQVPISKDDPLQGSFTLEQAQAGIDGAGELAVEFHTSMGQIDCELWAERAPLTVANFVGLARGKRPWKSESGWITRRFYDNTVIHRVVSGFVIQGGRPFDTVDGGPGYVIPDENWSGAKHDEAGLLCMANEGPNTGGSQFFIMAARSAPQLDGSYTIFGSCFQTDVVDAISRVKAFGERPAEDVILKQVVIKRAPRW